MTSSGPNTRRSQIRGSVAKVYRANSGATATPPTSTSFRADIQGLRALAVVLVVLDHAFKVPMGGFLGVDVFYVISGFLITGLLLRELERSGSISLRAFYARRIRRIVPAAALVAIVTIVMAFMIWHLPRAVQTLLDGSSAILFVSNWHFIAVGTDYLNAAGPVSPFQHYWSLSIEEQFYAVWPLALLGLTFLLKSRRNVLLVVCLLAVVSIGWSAYATVANPSAAYFDTVSRAWELLAGAILAFLRPASLSPRLRLLVSTLGVLIIVLGAVWVSPGDALPFPWVAPAVVGAVLVIWSSAPTGRFSLLGNPISQWLGNVSYSLYLWHFPVLIFAFSIWGESWVTGLLCIPVMLVLAALSRRFVERTFMKSKFLRSWSKAENERPFVWRDVSAGVVVLIVLVLLAVGQVRGPAPLVSANAVASSFGVQTVGGSSDSTDESSRRVEVQAALDADAWPSGPGSQLDGLFAVQQPQVMSDGSDGCRNSVSQGGETRVCSYAGDGVRIYLAGDSVALSWAPAIRQAFPDADLRVVGFANCPLFDVSVTNRTGSRTFAAQCDARRAEMMQLLDDFRPDIVFTAASETGLSYTELPLAEAGDAWESGVADMLSDLADVPSVIILSNPPLSDDPNQCATRLTGPASCVSEISIQFEVKSEAESLAADRFGNSTFIDTSPWFCVSGECPAFVGENVIKTDTSHMTEAAAAATGPLLRAASGVD